MKINNSILIALLIFSFSCISKKEFQSDCELLDPYFRRTNYCDRLDFLEVYGVCFQSTRCVKIFTEDMKKKTGISANLSGSFAGWIYANDSIFHDDIRKWREKLKCNQ